MDRELFYEENKKIVSGDWHICYRPNTHRGYEVVRCRAKHCKHPSCFGDDLERIFIQELEIVDEYNDPQDDRLGYLSARAS